MNYRNSGAVYLRSCGRLLEVGNITVFRALGSINYLAAINLVGVMNP
jgi:hypothetical protein